MIIYYDFAPLVAFICAVIFSVIVNIKSNNKIKDIPDYALLLTFCAGLALLVYAFSDFTKFDFIGKSVSFAILSNLYCATFALACRTLGAIRDLIGK